MSIQILESYKGKALSAAQVACLDWLADARLHLAVTGPAGKTIRILRGDQDLGYVNGTVTDRDALVGYHFQFGGRGSDSCPRELEGSLAEWASDRFNCAPSDLVIHRGAGANAHRTFLLIRTHAAAEGAFGVPPRVPGQATKGHPQHLLENIQNAFADAVQRSLSDSQSARLSRLAQAPRHPERMTVLTQTFARNPDVVAEALFRAEGTCERCRKPAPFERRSNGTPYLEVHHRVQLALGGEDTVANTFALCPNCHRELHHGSVALYLSKNSKTD